MVKTKVSGSPPSDSDEASPTLLASAKRIASDFKRAILDYAAEFNHARESAALAEADRFHFAELRSRDARPAAISNRVAPPPR